MIDVSINRPVMPIHFQPDRERECASPGSGVSLSYGMYGFMSGGLYKCVCVCVWIAARSFRGMGPYSSSRHSSLDFRYDKPDLLAMIGNDIISGCYFFTSKGRLASEMLELMKILFTHHLEKLQGGCFLTIKNGKDVWIKQQLTLQEIDETLKLLGKRLTDLGLPEPDIDENSIFLSDPVYNCDIEKANGYEKYQKLNTEQKYVVDTILNAVNNPTERKLFSLDEPGGTGKTLVFTTILHILRSENKLCLPVAFSGIAATLLDGGDFRQIIPVVVNGSRNDIIKASIEHFSMWPNFTQLQLAHNMRAHDDLEFAQWVLKVGDGSANEDSDDHLELPRRCIVDNSTVDHIFGVSLNTNDYKSYSMKAILTPKNDDCFQLNDQVVEKIPGLLKIYESSDAVVEDDQNDVLNYPVEFLNSITPAGLPPHILKLKMDKRSSFCSTVSTLGTTFAHNLRIPKSSCSICRMVSLLMPNSSSNILRLTRRYPSTRTRRRSTFCAVREVEGAPSRESSSTDSLPSLNRLAHS
nr:unnamed protein product [Callosobruchus chinensis]